IPVVPATPEAEGKGSLEFRSLRLSSAYLLKKFRFPISKPDGLSQLEQDLQVFDRETKTGEALRDDCSGEEENKLLIPKDKISEEVHSYKVITRKASGNSKEISVPGEFRQIPISKEAFTREKNNECNKPEKSFSLDSTIDADQKVLRIQNTDDNDKNDISSNQNSASGKHEYIDLTQDFQSSKCKEIFRQSSALTRHQRIHTREKPYKCKECEKSFSLSSSLGRHKRIHTREKPYKCEASDKSCEASDKSCSPSSGIIQHKKMHTRVKAYKCSSCERVFSHKMSCKCTICGSDFCHTSYLLEHQRVHHEEKSYEYDEYTLAYIKQGIHFREKPYTCNECGKDFRFNSHLIQHQKIHTGMKLHECDEYGTAFSQTSCLIHHQIMHRKEKSYKCNEYEGSFSHSSDLILQQEVLPRQKVFDCDVWKKNSSQRAHLVQYQSVHTKENS
uniref:C2H2-type domain-containing protein n=1 Tax=Nomascus leucogenys TaxID=61853 RepID=A0A2I3HYQ6_NOMLE